MQSTETHLSSGEVYEDFQVECKDTTLHNFSLFTHLDCQSDSTACSFTEPEDGVVVDSDSANSSNSKLILSLAEHLQPNHLQENELSAEPIAPSAGRVGERKNRDRSETLNEFIARPGADGVSEMPERAVEGNNQAEAEVPAATLFLEQTSDTIQEHGLFYALAKNCRGLVTADRVDELLEELRGEEWGVLLLSETWRTQREELWKTEVGHLFAASGHDSGRRGVGILLNKRWSRYFTAFHALSERLCYMDLKIYGVRYRIVSVYFPDGSYGDQEVQKVYDSLSEVADEARKRKLRLLIGGDFNARVGSGEDTAVHSSARKHGYGEQNARGQWLLTWSATKGLKIANTFYTKQDHKLVTHIGTDGIGRQLDYILVDSWTRAKLRDVEAGHRVDLGSDHLCLMALLNFRQKARKKRKKASKEQALWPPESVPDYVSKLDLLLDDALQAEALQDKYCKLQSAITEASQRTASSQQFLAQWEEPADHLRELIEQRRSLPSTDRASRCAISKQIRKEVRRIKDAERSAKIDKIL